MQAEGTCHFEDQTHLLYFPAFSLPITDFNYSPKCRPVQCKYLKFMYEQAERAASFNT